MVDSALRSSRRMSRLVSDLLLLARADAGRTGARRECDLTEVAAAAALRGAPGGERAPADDRRGRPGAGRGQPRRAPPPGAQPARQRPAPHAGRAPRSGSRSSGGTAKRCSRSPTTGPGSRRAWRTGLLPLRPRQRPGRPGRGHRHRAGPRDREGGRDLPRRRVDAGSSPAGGARFTVRLPCRKGSEEPGCHSKNQPPWELLGTVYTSPILSAWTRQPTRRGHPPTPPRRVNVGQSEPSDPPVFPLPDTGGSIFSGGSGIGAGADRRCARLVVISVQIAPGWRRRSSASASSRACTASPKRSFAWYMNWEVRKILSAVAAPIRYSSACPAGRSTRPGRRSGCRTGSWPGPAGTVF